jgi:bifunctional diaminopimelate decarboxylase / aspartate kinase
LADALINLHRDFAADLGVPLAQIEGIEAALHAALGAPAASAAGFAWQAQIYALGELWSSRLGAAYLSSQGLACGWLDARTQLLAQGAPNQSGWARYLSASCPVQRAPAVAQALLEGGPLQITQGFIARDLAGATVLLGRGGSDTSAACFGGLLGARRVEIWTDVPGMFSANPRRVPQARLLRHLDYDEAQEIATTGAKVLHPRCLGPVRDAGVPLWIKDTQRPDLEGTCIDGSGSEGPLSVKAISHRMGVTLVSMESIGMWQQVGFLADVFGYFRQHGLSVDLIGSAETNVTVSLDPSENLLDAHTLEALCADLARSAGSR